MTSRSQTQDSRSVSFKDEVDRFRGQVPDLNWMVWEKFIFPRLQTGGTFRETLINSLNVFLKEIREYVPDLQQMDPTVKETAILAFLQESCLDAEVVEQCLRNPSLLWKQIDLLSQLETALKAPGLHRRTGPIDPDWDEKLLQQVMTYDESKSHYLAWHCVVGNLTDESRKKVEKNLEKLLEYVQKTTPVQVSTTGDPPGEGPESQPDHQSEAPSRGIQDITGAPRQREIPKVVWVDRDGEPMAR